MSNHVWVCRECDGTGEFVDRYGEQCWVCKRCGGSGEQRREESAEISGEPLVPPVTTEELVRKALEMAAKARQDPRYMQRQLLGGSR